MEIKLSNYKLNTGLIGVLESNSYFLDFINDLAMDNKTITIDGKKLTPSQKRKFMHSVKIIEKSILSEYFSLTVYQYMRHYIMANFIEFKDYQKKILDALNIVGLKSINLDEKVGTLSDSEKKLLQFAAVLMTNPNMIIFDSLLEIFDLKLRKKVYNLLVQLVEKYNKIIVLSSNKANIIYNYTKYSIIIKDNKKIIEGDTSDIFIKNIRLLIDQGIEIPDIVLFSYKANTIKNAKLNYHKDTRDLIKDIYKKV